MVGSEYFNNVDLPVTFYQIKEGKKRYHFFDSESFKFT